MSAKKLSRFEWLLALTAQALMDREANNAQQQLQHMKDQTTPVTLQRMFVRLKANAFATDVQHKRWEQTREQQPFKSLGILLSSAEIVTLLDEHFTNLKRLEQTAQESVIDGLASLRRILIHYVAQSPTHRILDSEANRANCASLLSEERTTHLEHEGVRPSDE